MCGPTSGSGSGIDVPPTTNVSQWQAWRVGWGFCAYNGMCWEKTWGRVGIWDGHARVQRRPFTSVFLLLCHQILASEGARKTSKREEGSADLDLPAAQVLS